MSVRNDHSSPGSEGQGEVFGQGLKLEYGNAIGLTSIVDNIIS